MPKVVESLFWKWMYKNEKIKVFFCTITKYFNFGPQLCKLGRTELSGICFGLNQILDFCFLKWIEMTQKIGDSNWWVDGSQSRVKDCLQQSKIPKDWLNATFENYKIKCKVLFLQQWQIRLFAYNQIIIYKIQIIE